MELDDVSVTDGHLLGRVARLIDYVDEEGAEQDLYNKLLDLKIRNGFYLQELSALYTSHPAQSSCTPTEPHVEELFGAKKSPVQEPGIQSKVTRTSDAAASHRKKLTSQMGNQDDVFLGTVPQPFLMTLRDARKGDNTSSPSYSYLQDLQRRDEAECQRQFRAQPVPAHVFLSLYNELMEQQDTRRQDNINKRMQYLSSLQKPFSFIAKERVKLTEEITEAAPLQDLKPKAAPPQNQKKPTIPKSVLDPTYSDRLKEAELLRKITGQMRAQELLRSSAAPILLSRGTRDTTSSISLRNKQDQLSFLQQNFTFRPRTNPAVPDFHALYKVFQKEAMSKRPTREPVRPQPFTLRTAQLRDKKKPVRPETQRSDKDPASKAVSLASLSPNTLPVHIPDSTKQRESAIRSSLGQKNRQDEQKSEWSKKQKRKTQVIQKSLMIRAKALDPHRPLSVCHKEKLSQNRQAELQRVNEFMEELEQINRRVRERPYLFEQVAKAGVAREAEKRFTKTLQRAGVMNLHEDEEEITQTQPEIGV
ncbi:protein FAM161B [Bombina bombina]|uniref:protein FAM161B n=1 Tax=Bombina bombina TaxID=8345 RepID=UPI00235AD3F2|nr:protein FAM161B [Bombina bombina]